YTLAPLGLGARREGLNPQTAQKLSAKAGISPPPFRKGGLGGISSGRTPSCLPEIPLHPPLKKGEVRLHTGSSELCIPWPNWGLGERPEPSHCPKAISQGRNIPPFCKGG